MAGRKPKVDLVGYREIGERLDVDANTVRAWRTRAQWKHLEFPEPDWTVSGNPVWWWPTVEKWARAKGRM